MAHTLELFRDSIFERTKLSVQGETQRRMIQTAIETISDGFVLYDPEDRLVLCNNRFREIYPKLDDLTQPGTLFSEILRVGVERGVIETAGQPPDEWIAERLQRHADPKGLAEYHHGAPLGFVTAHSARRPPPPPSHTPISQHSHHAHEGATKHPATLKRETPPSRASSPI